MKNIPKNLLCLSHLRWDFVFQRPQHLLTRFSETSTVYFLEEPIFDSDTDSHLTFSKKLPNLWVCVPHLVIGLSASQINKELELLVDKFLQNKDLQEFAFWYYTPMALQFTEKYNPKITVFDCMDELSAFKFAPPELKDLEKKLLAKADIVFTGGNSLYEAKKDQHANIYPFPSSIEKSHFEKARKKVYKPADQTKIKGPKLGFYGVIDERFDIELIRDIADAKPEWQIMLIGPIVKIDPASLPKNKNIHYLGQKTYSELPAYLSGWDVALIPFMLNESTKFISPTKTPEYLAAGIPVVSSAIRDVVNPYGTKNLVEIGNNSAEFVKAIEKILKMPATKKADWLAKVDEALSLNSWDRTCSVMQKLMENTIKERIKISIAS